jgi:hypothetical protein
MLPKRTEARPELTREIENRPEPDPTAPRDPNEINPKLASDIAYWSKRFGVSGQILHEAIRVHGTHPEKVRAALENNQVSLT